MKKRFLRLVAALLTCGMLAALLPTAAFADAGTAELKSIDLGTNKSEVLAGTEADCSGDGWSYANGTLTVKEGYVLDTEDTYKCIIKNHGVIRKGNFTRKITNSDAGVIEGGVFFSNFPYGAHKLWVDASGEATINGITGNMAWVMGKDQKITVKYTGTEVQDPAWETYPGDLIPFEENHGTIRFTMPDRDVSIYLAKRVEKLTISENGFPEGFEEGKTLVGDRWSFEPDSIYGAILILKEGEFDLSGSPVKCGVFNLATITDGDFESEHGTWINFGTVTGGRFKDQGKDQNYLIGNYGVITGTAEFTGAGIYNLKNEENVKDLADSLGVEPPDGIGKIEGGTFYCNVKNGMTETDENRTVNYMGGIISGGTFLGEVTQANGGETTGGVFFNTVPEGVEYKTLTVQGRDAVINGVIDAKLCGESENIYAQVVGKTPVTVEQKSPAANTRWKAAGLTLTAAEAKQNPLTLTMPGDADVELSREDIPVPKPETYLITVEGGTASIDGAAVNYAEAGRTVTVTVNPESLNGEMEFERWEVVSGEAKLADETSSETTFVMPAGKVELKAHLKAKAAPAPQSGGVHPASVAAGAVVVGVGGAALGYTVYQIALELLAELQKPTITTLPALPGWKVQY